MEDSDYIVKYEPPLSGGILQKISRALFKGSLPFKNEIFINKLLIKQEFHSLNFPRSFIRKDSEKTVCIVFDIIDGEETRKITHEDKKNIVAALIEFSSLSSMYKNKGGAGKVFRLIESPTIRLIRTILFTGHNFIVKVKSIYLLVSFLLKKNRSGTVLLHNDLKCKNIIKSKFNEIYFIDFEDALTENIMVLADVVNILFDYKKCSIDKELLVKYWKHVLTRADNREENSMLLSYLRVCLLNIGLTTCPNKESTIGNQKQFLEMLLDGNRFNNWWLKQ